MLYFFILQTTLFLINKMKSTAILSLLVSVSMALPTITNARGAINAHRHIHKRETSSFTGTIMDGTLDLSNGRSNNIEMRFGTTQSESTNPDTETNRTRVFDGIIKNVEQTNQLGYLMKTKEIQDGQNAYEALKSNGDHVSAERNGTKAVVMRYQSGGTMTRVNGTTSRNVTQLDGDTINKSFDGTKKIIVDSYGEKTVLMQGTVTTTTFDKETGATKIVSESRNDDLHPNNPLKY
jgi:hypothetical protein